MQTNLTDSTEELVLPYRRKKTSPGEGPWREEGETRKPRPATIKRDTKLALKERETKLQFSPGPWSCTGK